jgi:hypothetical protein
MLSISGNVRRSSSGTTVEKVDTVTCTDNLSGCRVWYYSPTAAAVGAAGAWQPVTGPFVVGTETLPCDQTVDMDIADTKASYGVDVAGNAPGGQKIAEEQVSFEEPGTYTITVLLDSGESAPPITIEVTE